MTAFVKMDNLLHEGNVITLKTDHGKCKVLLNITDTQILITKFNKNMPGQVLQTKRIYLDDMFNE